MKTSGFAVAGVLPLAAALPSWLALAPRQASTITVDLTKTYQTMDGFGVGRILTVVFFLSQPSSKCSYFPWGYDYIFYRFAQMTLKTTMTDLGYVF
jgi:hypothetical protein